MGIKTEVLSHLFYVDNKNNVCVDNNKGHLSFLGRVINSLAGKKNYKIYDILKAVSAAPTKNLSESNIELIYKKVGKKLHINAGIVDRLFKCINSAEKKEDYQQILNDLSNECVKNKKQLGKLEEFKKHLDPNSEACHIVDQVIKETQLKAKLLGIKLDTDLAHTCPEDIEFLVKTRLIYSIVGYQNTTESGPVDHELKVSKDAEGHAYLSIKKQGQWVPVKQIKEEFDWDKKEGALASKANPNERWNYFHEGLVPVDRFYHHEVAHQPDYPVQNIHLKPVAKLSEQEMARLLEHAGSFEADEQKGREASFPKDAVIQVFSHPRPMSEKGWLKNLNAQVPVHCGIRIITKDGNVYSTGFGSTLTEDKYNTGLNKFLGTINGQPTIMDYEEFRPHEGRITTSIPVSSEQAQNILDQLNGYRENTIRFNILKQNCMKLGTNVLGMAGVNLNLRMPLDAMLYRALPDLPGKPIHSLKNRVNKLNAAIDKRVPTAVKKAFDVLGKIVWFVPTKFGALLKNLLALSLGGHIGSPIKRNQADNSVKAELEEKENLEGFKRLVGSLFDEEASDIQHSSIFINWQLNQKSTVVHQYTGQPSMSILPPQKEEQQKYSEERKAEFSDIYKYSTPIFA
ncbi:hypothetical protein [Candidatus Protochlamydia phocaeensis]|uniref:hypothetical protein n=1 Tax=Candidatus Protochlamydia phocaeensis TaxID=1414722 RepID=UPI000839238E|nr:hypothetical protein [Candidatus Protochlamydia phocaeensis]